MKEDQSTDILNLFEFRTNPALDFTFPGTGVAVCEGREVTNLSVPVYDGSLPTYLSRSVMVAGRC
jgi:hypothetical protein